MEISPSPGQLYQTASGHLYHAGKICIVMVGLPARGKTHRAVSVTRYLRWLGVRAKAFHLGNYRRSIFGRDRLLPEGYFMSADERQNLREAELRAEIIAACQKDIFDFYADGGQVAVYDAVNGRADGRKQLMDTLKARGIETFFVECLVTDGSMLARNIGDVRSSSPDYFGRDPRESVAHYLRALELRLAYYQPITERDLFYIKLVNDGEKCVVNNGPLGYLLNRVLLFLLNSRRPRGSLFFARAGATDVENETYKDDNDLSARGRQYATTLANTLLGYVSAKQLDTSAMHVDLQQVRRFADRAPSTANNSYTNLAAAAAAAASNQSAGTDDTEQLAAAALKVDAAPSAMATPAPSGTGTPTEAPLVVWTSTRAKTIQTSRPFREAGIPTSHRSLLNQINPGDAGPYTAAELQERYPAEYAAHQRDPYHHRYPRAESYQDVAIRLETLMMEVERVQSSLLIIAHESVLRVLYGYVMGSSVEAIPTLQFPANQIVEVVSSGYSNSVVRIPLAGVSIDGGVEPIS